MLHGPPDIERVCSDPKAPASGVLWGAQLLWHLMFFAIPEHSTCSSVVH